MGRNKIKVKMNTIMCITLTPELYSKIKKHAVKYDNGIVSLTMRQAVNQYIENFNN
jgi:hypothetical protein